DGIRDGHVTGVHTCALPISPETPASVALNVVSYEETTATSADDTIAGSAFLQVGAFSTEAAARLQADRVSALTGQKVLVLNPGEIGRASGRDREQSSGADGG